MAFCNDSSLDDRQDLLAGFLADAGNLLPLTILGDRRDGDARPMRAMSPDVHVLPSCLFSLCISVQGRSVLFLATSPLWAVRFRVCLTLDPPC